ncbi:MAG TPA: sodium:solute symporter [Flavipsychrobacter sp.]|nr:sodium:solute symporter [Flavipsychrobacter sp.]
MGPAVLLSIVLVYFAMLLGIAFYTSRHSNNESFFIGNRNSKWYIVAFGMIGTSLSGMTFISVPGTVGMTGFDYFQVVIGYWLGYFAVAFILLPLYYKLKLTSIYTYLDKRLGPTAYKTGALFFILSRTLGATLRLYLVIKVLELFVLKDMGISFDLTAIVILGLILLYTFRGGVKTIVWTDTLQTTFMLGALVICVIYIMHSLNLDLGGTWHAMQQKGYTKMVDANPLHANYFLKQIIGGAFITIGMTGLDQEMMQKNISVSNLRDSKKNMISFCFVMVVANFIFLLLGGLLYLYANAKGIKATGDDLFPTIAIKSSLPFYITVCFIIGLISAVFPSADGALTALTSSFCIDILGLKNKQRTEKQKMRTRLAVHNVFALIFLICVFFFRRIDNGSLIKTLLVVAGYTYGPLLALFAFGIFTKRTPRNELIPLICLISPILCYILKQYDKQWLGGYQIGYELLIINALIAYLLLILCSKKGSAVASPQIENERTDENKAARLDGNESTLQLADI